MIKLQSFLTCDNQEALTGMCSRPEEPTLSVTATRHFASTAEPYTSLQRQPLSLLHCDHWWMTTEPGCSHKCLVFGPLSLRAANIITSFNSVITSYLHLSGNN